MLQLFKIYSSVAIFSSRTPFLSFKMPLFEEPGRKFGIPTLAKMPLGPNVCPKMAFQNAS